MWRDWILLCSMGQKDLIGKIKVTETLNLLPNFFNVHFCKTEYHLVCLEITRFKLSTYVKRLIIILELSNGKLALIQVSRALYCYFKMSSFDLWWPKSWKSIKTFCAFNCLFEILSYGIQCFVKAASAKIWNFNGYRKSLEADFTAYNNVLTLCFLFSDSWDEES